MFQREEGTRCLNAEAAESHNAGRGLLKLLILCFNVTVSSLKERVGNVNNYCT